MRDNDIIDNIIKALVATRKWDVPSARRGIRAEFRCEYCDRDLFASVDDYKSWEIDHIVPISQGGTDNDENVALACRTCNFCIKRK